MERKLAAIMAADIVGYSLMMAENEASTYKKLRTVVDNLIEPTVARHGGRIFKMTGDGFLAMFPSVNEAVDAAAAIQQGFDNAPFELRIGINLGDVIEDNGDMYGDGVNVATRLEAMADPGSIFVSGAVVMASQKSFILPFCNRHAVTAAVDCSSVRVVLVPPDAGRVVRQQVDRHRRRLRHGLHVVNVTFGGQQRIKLTRAHRLLARDL